MPQGTPMVNGELVIAGQKADRQQKETQTDKLTVSQTDTLVY